MKTKDVTLAIFCKSPDPTLQAALDSMRTKGFIVVRESDLERVASALNVELVRE